MIYLHVCGNNSKMHLFIKLAVLDVSNSLWFLCHQYNLSLFFRTPEQCPQVVSLLSESYNPHVRFGAAMALGIACAGTGLKVNCLGKAKGICSLESLIQPQVLNTNNVEVFDLLRFFLYYLLVVFVVLFIHDMRGSLVFVGHLSHPYGQYYSSFCAKFLQYCTCCRGNDEKPYSNE